MGIRSRANVVWEPDGEEPSARASVRRRSMLAPVLAGLLVATGLAVILWPVALRALNADVLQSQAEQISASLAPAIREGAAERPLAQARAMNEELAARPEPTFGPDAAPQGYDAWHPLDDEAIARLDIPALNLSLPVFSGTSDTVLSRGVGHLPGSSLPVGGASSRCVIAGHTLYRDTRLFDDIPKLQPGDTVELTSCAGTLHYEVRETSVIEPTDTSALAIEPGHDLLTLLTCYPPGVITQRLLVTCERVSDSRDGTSSDAGAPGLTPPGSSVPAERGRLNRRRLPGALVAAICALASLASGIAASLLLVSRSRQPQKPH